VCVCVCVCAYSVFRSEVLWKRRRLIADIYVNSNFVFFGILGSWLLSLGNYLCVVAPVMLVQVLRMRKR
jgi:hypothetical protein